MGEGKRVLLVLPPQVFSFTDWKKSADINYLQPIVSSCILYAFTTGKEGRLFFTFNCVGILSGFFFFFKVDMEEAEAGRAG